MFGSSIHRLTAAPAPENPRLSTPPSAAIHRLTAPPALDAIYEFVIVRHGYSCANAWKQRSSILKSHSLYSDAELTSAGIQLCRDRKEALENVLERYFPDKSYKVGTSSLLRTQQTAYYMLLEGGNMKFSIFPHIAEEGIGLNNTPLPAKNQREIIGPDVAARIGEDRRGVTDLRERSHWPLFLKWCRELSDADRASMFHQTEDGVWRAVLFTHGHFMRKLFGEKKVENNDIFHAKFNATNGDILKVTRCSNFEPPLNKSSVEGCRIKTLFQMASVRTRRAKKEWRNTQRRNTQRRKRV